MTHHQVRLDQYKDFNPETSKWRDDKRSYEKATGGFQVLVAKNYSTLGIPCVAIYPDIDKGRFVGCKVAAPEGGQKFPLVLTSMTELKNLTINILF